MIAGTNDRPDDADELAAIARRLRAHVNLIPLNPTPGFGTRGSSPEAVEAFRRRLDQAGVHGHGPPEPGRRHRRRLRPAGRAPPVSAPARSPAR